MKAHIDGYDIRGLGPALNTRQEHSDGLVSYEAVYDVHLEIKVVGNDASEFVKHLRTGTEIKGIEISNPVPYKATGPIGGIRRRYVFE